MTDTNKVLRNMYRMATLGLLANYDLFMLEYRIMLEDTTEKEVWS